MIETPPRRRPRRSRASTASSAASPPADGTPLRWLARNYLLAGLLLGVVLALLAEAPWLPGPGRALLLLAAALGLSSLLALGGPLQDDLRAAMGRGPHPFLIALLVWCGLSAALIAPHRGQAAAEMLRIVLCLAVYVAAAYGLRSEQLRTLVGGALVIGVAVSVADFARFSAEAGMARTIIVSVFGNHENQGSFLLVLLPVALALGLSESVEEKTRIGAQAVALVLGAALLLARTRSAWMGAVAALLTLAILAVRYTPPRLSRRNKQALVSPLLIVLIAFSLLIALGQLAPLLSERANTLTIARVLDDSSLSERLFRWGAAARMTSERPLTGWGLGMWPVLQGRWTHQGDDAWEVLKYGTGHQNLAHNFWVQWAAETGVVGLVLYLAAVAAFVLSALRALPAITSGYRKALLMGCVAAVVGACVDKVGSPAYTFPGVSALFWLWMGIGIAACRETRQQAPALPPARPALWWSAALAGAGAALLVLGVGYKERRDGLSRPRGTLAVMVEAPGRRTLSTAAGAHLLWTAVYKDPSGKLTPTAPGTSWRVTTGALGNPAPAIVDSGDEPSRSGLQGTLLPNVPSVTVTATYWDEFSRRYDASATVTPGKNPPPLSR